MSGWNTNRNRSMDFKKGPKHKKQSQQGNRPGKRKRQQGWSGSGGKKVKRQKT